jgi:predicted Zn-ribbon and HTH transcriptional regulator
MNNVEHDYRQLMTTLTSRLREGERDIELLVGEARERLQREGKLAQSEIDQLTHSVRRDLQEFAHFYDQHRPATRVATPVDDSDDDDSVFMRVIKESLWQELADITDKTQLEWKEVLKDVIHHGVYHSGEVVGLGNLVCEKCHFHLAVYTPEVLSKCPKCGNDEFSRQPFEP